MPGICGTPPFATVFIIFDAWSKRVTSALTSVTVVPEPFAMRRRREPLSTFGVRRSCTVIDWMIASVRVISRLVEVVELLSHALAARQHAEHPLDGAHVLELLHLGRGSPRA